MKIIAEIRNLLTIHHLAIRPSRLIIPLLCTAFAASGTLGHAQVNVLTEHNDLARTGQNLQETILTPANVSPTTFGKLFTMHTDGYVFAQPLYVSQVAVPGKGTHNIVYAFTSGDSVFAFDGDDNGGVDAQALWSVSLLTNTPSAGTLQNRWGIYGTPVIDISTKTLYLVSSEVKAGADIFRLHALDITSGAEKFGGPVTIQGSVPGTGSGSVGGVVAFNPQFSLQRPGLLLQGGMVYIAIGSISDNGPYHGWIFSYSAATLQQRSIYNSAPNGSGGGIWMSGAGLTGQVYDPVNKPYGRLFFVSGNGTYSVKTPYDNTMSYGQSIVTLDLTGGIMKVVDAFTPANELLLNGQDGDVGSGGAILLPSQTLPSGTTTRPLVQIGKSGDIYVLDSNNLGGFNPAGDQIIQEVQTPESGSQNWGAGIWGDPAYWNNMIYAGGTNPGISNSLTAYSFKNGKLSLTPVSQSTEKFGAPSPTPAISANGIQNGIVWLIDTNGGYQDDPAILVAYDATNLQNLLYSASSNIARDNPGVAVKYVVPTIANGKVYVGAINRLSVYGLLGATPTAAAPVLTPGTGTFTGSASVSISDSTPGAQIYYTTDGSVPTANSRLYTGPVVVTASETVTAIASATHYLQSAPSSAIYSSTANAANPALSLASGSYSGSQTVTISDASSGAHIYYTLDGTQPTTSSNLYVKPISVTVSETVRAFATAPGLKQSAYVTASYVIEPVYDIDFTLGFANSAPSIQFNGSTDLDDVRLQLTNGGNYEAGSAFYKRKVNVQAFTSDFTVQLSNPRADGVTFTIQNAGLGALGGEGGYLGYGGIPKSVAVKLDIFSNDGEGPNSTGLYINGAAPTVPAIDLTGSGLDLHSGDQFNVHVTYDGAYLTFTLTDVVSLTSWSHSYAVDIPAIVGGPTAYVGFTGGSGGLSASQKFTYWTYVAGAPSAPNFPAGFHATGLSLNKSAISGSALQLTNGTTNDTASAFYVKPVSIQSFATHFDFQLTNATADGFTFTIQNQAPTALGNGGEGLGYQGLPQSVAMKFDIYNNAGEGTDSTGIYVNGAMPTLPAIDLTSTGLKLSNGDTIHVDISYDGKTLSWAILDTVIYFPHHVAMSGSTALNIANTLGSNTAYVGFTASSGGQTALQNILDWTFSNP